MFKNGMRVETFLFMVFLFIAVSTFPYSHYLKPKVGTPECAKATAEYNQEFEYKARIGIMYIRTPCR